VSGRVVIGTLTAPPPCDACGSTKHGHIRLGDLSIACPDTVDISGTPHAYRDPKTGVLSVRLPLVEVPR
jgi:hypothetical protein